MSCGSKKLPTPGAAWCMRWFMGLLILSCVTSIAAGTGMCGHQCTDDGDCLGCGGAGKCSCPDAGTPFSAISCSCVDMPSDPPTHPPADIKLSTWPMQWSANVSAFVYADFTNHTSLAAGRFYYDGIGGHSRADWRPYTSGNDATQVWIADWKAGKSNYYVKSGPLCISFPIRVPGTQVAVGVERPDWMPRCEAAGIARYAGRERVGVNGRAVWVDHYSCHVEDIEANQAITFQNWHSLGLAPDDPPKGLPLRVTGGNSAPDGQKGSPRLSTVWYSDFQVGPASSSPSDFKRPALVCIPVALEVAEAFVGGRLTAASVFDATFHPAAHALLESVHATRPIIPEAELPGRTSIEASSTLIPNADHIATTTNADATDATDAALASSFDLRRAQTSRPRPAYQGRTFESMNEALNKALQRMPAVVASEACERFTLSELRELMAEHLLPVADEVGKPLLGPGHNPVLTLTR